MMLKYLNPILWFRWFGQFVVGWVQSIAWRKTPRAIPAILLTAALTMTAVIALNDGSSWRTDRLDRQWNATLEVEDYETAELVLMRQLHMRPEDSQLIFRLALVRDARGQTQDAIDLMWRLVRMRNSDSAARWLFEKLYTKKEWIALTDLEKAEVGELLSLMHRENPKDISIQQQYADYLIASEKFSEAIPVLSGLIKIQPMRGLQAAAISRKLGDEVFANRMAARTLESVAKLSKDDPTNSNLALAVAQNQLFLAQFDDAIETLERARQRAKTPVDEQKLGDAIGDSYVAWINQLDKLPTQDLPTRLEILRMLQNALARAPKNPRVLTLVADRVLAAMDEEDAQVATVREALISGSSTGIAHFIRGTSALLRNDLDSATTSLKLAAEHMPESGAILNNLAVALAAREPADLESALKISESAIKQSANPTPYFYETRGQILFRLGRYLDAIPDLERALPLPALAYGAHSSLAICYEQVGDKELAQLHREKADALAPDKSTEPAAPQ